MDPKKDPEYIAHKIGFLQEQLEAMRMILVTSGSYRKKLKELSYWKNRQIQIGNKFKSK